MRRFLCFIVLLCVNCKLGFAQEMKNNYFLDFAVRNGTFVTNFYDDNFKNSKVYGVDLRFGKQTFGRKEWEQWHLFPAYGLMLRYGKFDNPRLDQKLALLVFINGKIVGKKWFALKYEFASGLVFWFNRYYPEKNPDNNYIGSVVNCHINLSLSANFMVSKSLDLIVRGSFSHSSNGVLKMPNLGVNMISGDIALRYYIKKRAEQFFTKDVENRFSTVNTLLFYYAPGVCKSRKLFDGEYSPKLYYTSTLQIAYYRQPHPVYRFGGGLDFMFNEEIINRLPEEKKSYGNCFSIGAFASIELIYDRLLLSLEVGTYPYRAHNFADMVYERFGFKFMVDKKKNLFFGIALKAHAARAESIEWIMGYQFFNWKDKKNKQN